MAVHELIKRNPLVAFFLFAYTASWLAWVPLVARSLGLNAPVLPYHHYLGAFGPMLGALIVSASIHGRTGLRELVERMVRWRVGLRWYLVAVLSPVLLFVAATTVTSVLGGELADLRGFGHSEEFPQLGVLGVWIVQTLTFGIGEETGWRGYALPRLQRNHSALTATLILCIFWAVWHLPAFFYRPGYSSMDWLGIGGWFFSLVTGAILMTWLYNSAKGSLLIVSLFHGSIDVAFTSKGVGAEVMNIMGILIVLWAIAVLVIARPANLSFRGKEVSAA